MSWRVVTVGFSKGTNEEVDEIYGPFHTRGAAKRFQMQWEMTFRGIAVIDKIKEGGAE